MRLEDLNAFDPDAAVSALLLCCGSSRWARQMAAARPFATVEAMLTAADQRWGALDPADWLQAFAAHPKIGEGRPDPDPPVAKTSAERGAARDWPAQEQAGIAAATAATRLKFVNLNRDYEARFGYIFIVCATGQSAAGMLDLLERRIVNDAEAEIRIAAEEQRKITHLRLMKLVDGRQDMTR